MAEQRADLLEIVMLLEDLHRDAMPEVVRLQRTENPGVGGSIPSLPTTRLGRVTQEFNGYPPFVFRLVRPICPLLASLKNTRVEKDFIRT